MILPVHERLVGRTTLADARSLEWSQWAAPDDLLGLQERKLRELLIHAHDRIPFYRRRLQDVGADPRRDDPRTVLARLPFLTKDEIRESRDELIWRDAPGGLFSHNTGGSSGEPLMFVIDRRRQGYDQAARIRTHRWFGVRQGDRELLLWGSPIERRNTDAIKSVRDFLLNQRLLDAFNMSPSRMDEFITRWNRFRPHALFGYPSSIAFFAEHIRARSAAIDTGNLRAVFVTGETLLPPDRELIASLFGVPVADCYGSREAGFIAHQCPLGAMHVTAENVIVEIADGLRVLPIGETGEIVVTHLDAYAMPFIRYRTGDMGRLLPGRCSCGRGLPLMDVVAGRKTDFLHLPDGTVKHALSIIYPLRETPGVRRFRVTQHEDFAVTVDVVVDERIARITAESIRGRVRPVLGDQARIAVNLVDRIDEAASGKFRYVVSHVGRDAPASGVPTHA